ncbi:MAG: FliH/SctL family protein [Myxococcota bacterium]
MSSSDSIKPLTLVDLQQEAPPAPVEDFCVQTEFPRILSEAQRIPTPDEAYRNGLSEGEQRGREAALKELQPEIEELRRATSALVSVRSQRLEQAESDLVEVAVDLARRILHGELTQDGDVVLRMARACIEEASHEGELTLRVAPQDLELVRAHLPEFEPELSEGSVCVQADAGLERGSVVLETPRRCFDGRPERILQQVVATLEAEATDP